MGCEVQNKILKGKSELKASAGSTHCYPSISRCSKIPNNKKWRINDLCQYGKFSNRKKIKCSTGIFKHLKTSFCITDITAKSKKRLVRRSH